MDWSRTRNASPSKCPFLNNSHKIQREASAISQWTSKSPLSFLRQKCVKMWVSSYSTQWINGTQWLRICRSRRISTWQRPLYQLLHNQLKTIISWGSSPWPILSRQPPLLLPLWLKAASSLPRISPRKPLTRALAIFSINTLKCSLIPSNSD